MAKIVRIMKKIMFSDKFLLTQAVIEGRKTQTRRLIKCRKTFKGEWVAGFNIHIRPSDKKVVGLPCMYDADEREFDGGEILPKYKVGEVVAVAQSYKSVYDEQGLETMDMLVQNMKNSAGWDNKMFVKPELMPRQIHITNVCIERLQDISDEDCLKEGIIQGKCGSEDTHFMDAYYVPNDIQPYCTPYEAFAFLIEKVSGKGTWDANPYVWVYDFELIQ